MAYQPTLGGSSASKLDLQFPTAAMDRLSLATTPIELLAVDGSLEVLSHGTGFFWRGPTGLYLLTARHVLSGRDPFTDELVSGKGFIPHLIRVYPALDFATHQARTDGVIMEVHLDGQPLWREDPDFQQLRTDIAALPFGFALPDGSSLICLNDQPFVVDDKPLLAHIGFDCFILGYPIARSSDLRTPIWRRATFASEPLLPVDGKPMFLVDASTSPGFSGAPVLRRHIGPAPLRCADGSIEIKMDSVVMTDFAGVYAGRLQNQFVGGEVPFVFYGNRVPLIAT